MEAPKRRFELTVKIGADTWARAVQDLMTIAYHVEEHGMACNLVSGGCDSGYSVQIVERPEQTPEKFQAELEEFVSTIRAELERGDLP